MWVFKSILELIANFKMGLTIPECWLVTEILKFELNYVYLKYRDWRHFRNFWRKFKKFSRNLCKIHIFADTVMADPITDR